MHRALNAARRVAILESNSTSTEPSNYKERNMSSVHDFTAQTIHGQDADLAAYTGKALLVVNVASECGLTPQYADLEALHRQYAAKGLVVLGFPCNQFGGQEPNSEEQILDFCQTPLRREFSALWQDRGQRPQPSSALCLSRWRGCGLPRRHLLELREIPHRREWPTAGPASRPGPHPAIRCWLPPSKRPLR